jgi:hypothetical protein
MFSSWLVIEEILKPRRYCSSISPKVQVSGSHRTRNSSTHVNLRPCLMRRGSARARMWCIAVVMPGASLPLRGSLWWGFFAYGPAEWAGCGFKFRGGVWSPRWGGCSPRAVLRVVWKVASWQRPLVGGTVSQPKSRMALQRRAMVSSHPVCLVILFPRFCQWAMLGEANVARNYERAWVTFGGRGKRIEGLAHMSSLSSKK